MSDTDRLTVPEVAALLRCGPRKALALMGNEIPAVLDYRWTARRVDVEDYLAAHTVTDRSSKARTRGRRRRSA